MHQKVGCLVVFLLFPVALFETFRLLFAHCYIDDGCGPIDPLVIPITLLIAAAVSITPAVLLALTIRRFTKSGDTRD